MAHYLIGDVQGCDEALGRLLAHIGFSASRDTVYLLGDLVNRGPDSLAVLRRVQALDGAARCLLGNHDLHLLALAHGVRPPHRSDTLGAVLAAPDRDALLHWLRQQPLAMQLTHEGISVLMVHAGVLPQWDCAQTLALAAEVQAVLQGPQYGEFLAQMYGNTPVQWDDTLQGPPRWRVIVNALTRLRFCDAQGRMEFESKEGLATTPAGFTAWFDAPGRRTATDTVAFGHWSTLGWLERPDVLSLDSGCVWGACLSALRLEPSMQPRVLRHTLLQVDCPQAQKPGG